MPGSVALSDSAWRQLVDARETYRTSHYDEVFREVQGRVAATGSRGRYVGILDDLAAQARERALEWVPRDLDLALFELAGTVSS